MSTAVKTFEGTYDEATSTTTLSGECRDPETGRPEQLRIVSVMKDDDTMTCTIYGRGDDGKETEVGKIESKRRK